MSILEKISVKYGSNLQFYPPVSIQQLENTEKELDISFPTLLKELLLFSNGVGEIATIQNENIMIGWIIYNIETIISSMTIIRENYDFEGIIFGDDGTGDPFFINSNNEVCHFNLIVSEVEKVSDTILEFFSDK